MSIRAVGEDTRKTRSQIVVERKKGGKHDRVQSLVRFGLRDGRGGYLEAWGSGTRGKAIECD
jgi:hypothetical protein